MAFKTKIITLFLIPGVTLYALLAGLIFKGTGTQLFELKALPPTAIMAAICALAQDITPRSFKEALVFWRMRDRLPGCRAFQRDTSDRYDLSRLTNLEELRALSGSEQQRAFYKIYKKHQKDAPVAHFSFRYSAWRDLSSLYFLLAVLTVPAAATLPAVMDSDVNLRRAAILAAFSFVAYLLTAVAARLSANSLVGQVLSCETGGRRHAINT